MGLLDDVRSVQYGTKVSKALLYLAQGYDTYDAARHARVLHVTLLAWMSAEDFMVVLTFLKEYAKMRHALDVMTSLTDDAIAALRRTMQTGSPGQALQAARDVLERVELFAERQEQAELQVRREVRLQKRRRGHWE